MTPDQAITERAPTADFDLFAPTTMAESNGELDRLRERCPVAWTDRNGGHWVISGYPEVADAFRDWETFSSARTDPEICAITIGRSRLPLLTPEEIDPPEWYPLRRILAELLSPKASEALRGRAHHWTEHYIDRFIEAGRCDFVTDLVAPVPTAVVLEWLGFPPGDWARISKAFHDVSAYQKGTPAYDEALQAYGWVMTRIREEVGARRRDPRDDAMSAIADHDVDGERIAPEVAESIVFMTIGGGVDTTTSLTAAALVHLARNPDDRARLLAEPDLLDTATEEFLRYYPPARAHARTVTVDTELGGCPMRAGDRVLLSEASAGRDERAFPDADRFVIDRFPNRHVSFGVGIHRCPGSHLARIEFAEMMTQVLERLPDYRIDPAAVVEYPNWSAVSGWASIPATFTPGPRRGAG